MSFQPKRETRVFFLTNPELGGSAHRNRLDLQFFRRLHKRVSRGLL
jgi:hypothetical protein